MNGLISNEKLEEIIEEKFDVKENLDNFYIDKYKNFLGLRKRNYPSNLFYDGANSGYFFIFYRQLKKFSGHIIDDFISVFENAGAFVEYFVDSGKGVAGFSWQR